MALEIYTNNYSITAQRYLNLANAGLAKNIERLSSGLRINHAADDASGLAISEKMRAQIRGIKRATLNSQDAISYLQTAEGGMSTMTDIIQRMRELAVQAGNGTYTTNDRRELQKEIDQLKAEIDRQAASTEFNTKKLLNGDSTALWSADKPYINAIIRSEVAEGNYRLDFSVRPGQNNVYKTDIMTLNKDAIGAGIVSANTTNVGQIVDPKGLNPTHTAYYTIGVEADANVTAAFNAIQVYKQASSNWNTTQAITNIGFDGFVEMEFTTSSAGAGDFAGIGVRYRTIDASTGAISQWYTATSTAAGVVAIAAPNISATVTFDVNALGNAQGGDKILFTANRAVLGANLAAADGRGVIKISDGPNELATPITISYDVDEGLTKKDNGDQYVDYNDVKITIADMDATNGTINIGSMVFQFKENSDALTGDPLTVTGAFQLMVNGAGEAATTGTRLKDIARFTNADGRNILDNVQELTVFGNGKQTIVYVEGNDTIADLERKLTKAIVEDLGMGADNGVVSAGGSFTMINGNLVNYVGPTGATLNSNEALAGTFVIQTGLLGDDSRLTFTGDQGLIDALSLATIQQGENSTIKVTVRDAHTGDLVGSEIVGDGVLRGIIKGVEVEIDSKVGIYERWDAISRKIVYRTTGKDDTAYLHVVDNRTDVQVGANKGQSMDISVTQLDCRALGILNMSVVDPELAQKGITLMDRALERISSARASVGAQINRLEYTISGLQTAYENMVASESRIRDLDYAEETALFTRNQILVNAAVSMLSQANRLPEVALELIRG